MIEDLLKKRHNISWFSKEKIPEKETIQKILEKSQELTPHKNNFWHYEIGVYGPEHAEEKKKFALTTVCNKHKDHFRQENLPKEEYKKLEKGYQDWLDYYDGDQSKEYVIKDKWHFNQQVTAPYLLAYYPAKVRIRESQKQGKYYKSGRAEYVFSNMERVNKDEFNIQAGMNATVLTLLALKEGLEVSFCKCYFYNKNLHTEILADRMPTFTLGIGYKDETKRHSKTWIDKPTFDEVVKWQ